LGGGVIKGGAAIAGGLRKEAKALSKAVAKTKTGGGGGGGGTVRLRHYTNTKGLEGIEESSVLRAKDQDKVFFDKASGKPLSPRDAEDTFGLKPGRGRHVVETDVPADRIEKVWNEVMKVWEYQVKGDVELSNPTFIKR
jgi:hypothetical protein